MRLKTWGLSGIYFGQIMKCLHVMQPSKEGVFTGVANIKYTQLGHLKGLEERF